MGHAGERWRGIVDCFIMKKTFSGICLGLSFWAVQPAAWVQAAPVSEAAAQTPAQQVAWWTKVIAEHGSESGPYNQRAMAYAALGEFDAALADCTQAIALAPRDAVLYFNRAQVYAAQEKYVLMQQDCTQAIALDPRDPDF